MSRYERTPRVNRVRVFWCPTGWAFTTRSGTCIKATDYRHPSAAAAADAGRAWLRNRHNRPRWASAA